MACFDNLVKFCGEDSDEKIKRPARTNLSGKVNAMTPRKAVGILMQSPFYFRMDLAARCLLIREFCALHNAA